MKTASQRLLVPAGAATGWGSAGATGRSRCARWSAAARPHGVVDEIPGAYKPIEKVIDQQRGRVEVAAKLMQVVCVKG
jgi:RNA-splicing ligase RtcB